ncbi:MAG: glycosyltransferase [Novosphingobium sp.]|nr:glycosyltransferase [Novosphingobium sp.]
MKIVDVCGFYSPVGGGVKTYVERKLAAAPWMGHEVVVIAPGPKDTEIEVAPGARLVTMTSPVFPLDPRYHYFSNEIRLHELLDRFAPDVVECSTPWSSPGMVARWPGKARRSLIMHCDPLSAYPYRWFGSLMERDTIDRGFEFFWRHLRRLGASYDLVVCANQNLASRLSDGGVANVVTEPMGVQPHIFSPRLRDEALRGEVLRDCGLDADATLLIGVGRLSSEKRWSMVIDAVTAAGYDRKIGMVLVGEGRERRRLLRQIGGNPHIRLIGPITERGLLSRMLASADALVHGCEAETFGMVAAEARASGIPVIAPDMGGASDFAGNGMGWRYRAGHGPSLLSLLRWLDPDDYANCRLRASRVAGGAWTMDEHFAALFARYEALPVLAEAA